MVVAYPLLIFAPKINTVVAYFWKFQSISVQLKFQGFLIHQFLEEQKCHIRSFNINDAPVSYSFAHTLYPRDNDPERLLS